MSLLSSHTPDSEVTDPTLIFSKHHPKDRRVRVLQELNLVTSFAMRNRCQYLTVTRVCVFLSPLPVFKIPSQALL